MIRITELPQALRAIIRNAWKQRYTVFVWQDGSGRWCYSFQWASGRKQVTE